MALDPTFLKSLLVDIGRDVVIWNEITKNWSQEERERVLIGWMGSDNFNMMVKFLARKYGHPSAKEGS